MAIVRTAEININTNAGQARNDVENLNSSVESLEGNTSLLSDSIDRNSIAQETSNGLMSIADKLTGGLASSIRSAAQNTGLLTAAQKAMTVATGAGTSAMQIFKIALASTGIGLIVIAVGLLISYLVKLNPVMDVVEQGMAAIGAVINTVQQALAKLFSGDLSGFATLGEDMSNAAKAAVELEKALQDIDDVMKSQEVQNAKFKNQYDELILSSKNRTLTEQQRIDMLKKADQLELANYNQRKAIAQENERIARQAIINEAGLTQAEAVELMKRGVNYKEFAEGRLKNADDLFDKLGEAQKNSLALENESIQMRTKSQNKQDALQEKIEAERQKKLQEAQAAADKARQKREAEAEKARAKREAEEKAYNDARIKLIREIEDLEDTTEEQKTARRKSRAIEEINALKGKSEAEKKILLDNLDKKFELEARNANNKAFLDLEKKLQEDLKNLQLVSDQQKLDARKKADLDAINALKGKSEAEKQQLITTLNEKYAIEQADLDKKKQKEITDAIEKATIQKTYEDAKTFAEVQAIQTRALAILEAERIAAEQLLIQRGATEEQLAALNKGYTEKAEEEKKNANARNAQLEQAKYDFTKRMATDGINLVDSLEKIGIVKGKAAAKAKKILTLSQVAVDTGSAISSLVAYSNSAGAAAGPAGLAVSIATYAAGGLQILSNIAKAKKLLSAGDGDSAGGASTSTASASPTAPNMSFQPSAQSQLANTINTSQNQNPIKVYTVAKDMTTQQELDRNINDSAKF